MTRDEVILTAVQWWSDKLASRAPHSNGDNSSASVLACMFADIGSKELTRIQLSLFEGFLTSKLQSLYDQEIVKWKSSSFSIGCDYGPCSELIYAAENAEINLLNFPFKTWMRIGKDYVEVSDGYGKPWVRI